MPSKSNKCCCGTDYTRCQPGEHLPETWELVFPAVLTNNVHGCCASLHGTFTLVENTDFGTTCELWWSPDGPVNSFCDEQTPPRFALLLGATNWTLNCHFDGPAIFASYTAPVTTDGMGKVELPGLFNFGSDPDNACTGWPATLSVEPI